MPLQFEIAAVNRVLTTKVVKMLQSMTSKIEAEAEKEKELYEKYMCYCKSSAGTLKEGIATAEDKIPKVGDLVQMCWLAPRGTAPRVG
eukprot:5183364-Amphidinium_carterae.1